MIFMVAILDNDETPEHVLVFENEDTITDEEAVEYAAEDLDIPMPEMESTQVFRASKASSGEVWLRIKDYELDLNSSDEE